MLRRLLSLAFILISKLRVFLYKQGTFKSLKVRPRVVSIGNISMGGSGKTPLVLKLVNKAVKNGSKAVVIERGYKGNLEKGQIVCAQKGKDITPDVKIVGDEAKMVWEALLDGARLCVSKSKAKGASLLQDVWQDTDIIFVDDGFQHLALQRDIDLVLVDASSGFSEKVFPMGILREPYSALKRADIILFTKADDLNEKDKEELVNKARAYNPELKVFFANTSFHSSHDLKGKKVLPVSAVFNGAHFRSKLKKAGAIFERYIQYSDHREFGPKEIEQMYSFKKETRADLIALTKKDWAKVEKLVNNSDDVIVCWYEHVIDDEEGFVRCCIGS